MHKVLTISAFLFFALASMAQNVGIGVPNPGAKLEVAGGVKISDSINIGGQVRILSGTPGAGKVLTSDAIGVASWATPATTLTYTMGLWPELGGYVFWVSADGKHGLIAETQDQGLTSWYNAQNLISNPANHSANGAKFRDWRMPTLYELNEMYLQRGAIGGFAIDYYWSSTENGTNIAWVQNFDDGLQVNNANKSLNFSVRSVRAF